MQASELNLKKELQLTHLKEPFCAALHEGLLYFTSEQGKKHILRGFAEAGILSCWGADSSALYEKALMAQENGTLFPGGKNTAIDALVDEGDSSFTVPSDVPTDCLEAEGATRDQFDLLGDGGDELDSGHAAGEATLHVPVLRVGCGCGCGTDKVRC